MADHVFRGFQVSTWATWSGASRRFRGHYRISDAGHEVALGDCEVESSDVEVALRAAEEEAHARLQSPSSPPN